MGGCVDVTGVQIYGTSFNVIAGKISEIVGVT